MARKGEAGLREKVAPPLSSGKGPRGEEPREATPPRVGVRANREPGARAGPRGGRVGVRANREPGARGVAREGRAGANERREPGARGAELVVVVEVSRQRGSARRGCGCRRWWVRSRSGPTICCCCCLRPRAARHRLSITSCTSRGTCRTIMTSCLATQKTFSGSTGVLKMLLPYLLTDSLIVSFGL